MNSGVYRAIISAHNQQKRGKLIGQMDNDPKQDLLETINQVSHLISSNQSNFSAIKDQTESGETQKQGNNKNLAVISKQLMLLIPLRYNSN